MTKSSFTKGEWQKLTQFATWGHVFNPYWEGAFLVQKNAARKPTKEEIESHYAMIQADLTATQEALIAAAKDGNWAEAKTLAGHAGCLDSELNDRKDDQERLIVLTDEARALVDAWEAKGKRIAQEALESYGHEVAAGRMTETEALDLAGVKKADLQKPSWVRQDVWDRL
jgi:phosphosulfolactate synthase (CoM biosynthesis protein A)